MIPDTINGLPVTSLGADAFEYNVNLTSVTIPNSVTNIDISALYGCSNLTAINITPNNPRYSSMGGVLFDVSQTKLIECPSGLAGSYAIPNSVTNIGDYAFE